MYYLTSFEYLHQCVLGCLGSPCDEVLDYCLPSQSSPQLKNNMKSILGLQRSDQFIVSGIYPANSTNEIPFCSPVVS